MTPNPFYRRLLKLMGWKAEGEAAKEKNCIYLMAPHTSIWDFAIGYFYYRSLGGRLKIMAKKEAFFFPLGNLLRAKGGFPIDRKNPQGTILSIVHEMSREDGGPFHLAICPEGTRKPVKKWKTGYHVIAEATGAPVYLTYIDYGKKRVGILPGKVELTDDARGDTDRIQQTYESMNLTGLHKKDYITH